MKRLFMTLALALAGVGALWAGPAAAAICPTTSNTNTDCGIIYTVQPDGTVTSALVPGANPFDGSDDALVGVVNNSSAPFTTLMLMGPGNGGGIFEFDGDGICTFTNASYCSSTQFGYEGPQNTFSNINAGGTSGTVNFTGGGIAPGATTFFSLEGSPQSITPVNPVPEPATLAVLGASLLGLGFARRRGRA